MQDAMNAETHGERLMHAPEAYQRPELHRIGDRSIALGHPNRSITCATRVSCLEEAEGHSWSINEASAGCSTTIDAPQECVRA